jgi:thiamine phosphate synthase YjbQ (UPF0047 family)
MFRTTLTVKTGSREEFIDITAKVRATLSMAAVDDGILTLFVPQYHRGRHR